MKLDWRDLALRAAHTFWQFFVVAFGGLYAASGADITQVIDVSSAKRFAAALIGAAAAAALVALRLTVKALAAAVTSRSSWTPDEIAAALDDLSKSSANVTQTVPPADSGLPQVVPAV